MLPDLSFSKSLRISAFVSVSFLLALAVICAIVSFAMPMANWLTLSAALVLALTVALLSATLLKPEFQVFGFQIRLPSLSTCGAIFGWTVIDTCAAGFALYVLMPSAELTLGLVLPAYLLALGAGLISSAPGGVGPFELALLALLPAGTDAEVLAGAVAFRMIYYAVPATLGGLALIRPLSLPGSARTAKPSARALSRRPAELGVLRQNKGRIAVFDNSICALWPTPQTLSMLLDPLAGAPAAALGDLQQAARAQNKIPALYKCNARTALAARQAGWQVVHLADEAVLNPTTFDPAQRACRDLRRKLRQGERAGVQVHHATDLPIPAMARIDSQWQAQKGRARGGSMGRFCRDYLARQRVYLAYHEGRLIGYISLHVAADEWCLDLMRQGPDAPHGTMQMLICAALDQARAAGIPRFSLAAVPAHPQHTNALMDRAIALATPLSKTSGLKRFKRSFAPRWERRYGAAPGPGRLALALFDITRSIHAPLPLGNTSEPHKEDEECELALRINP